MQEAARLPEHRDRMTPLDLRERPPRAARDSLLGFYLLARTIDKLRAELPGGDIGDYLNGDAGFSAYVVKGLGLDMDDFRDAVERAADENAVHTWLETRIDLSLAPALNAKLETFVVQRMTPEDRVLIAERHPVMTKRPDLSKILDIIDAQDGYPT